MPEVNFGAGSQPIPTATQSEAKAPTSEAPALRESGNRVLGDYVPGMDEIKLPVISLVHEKSETAGRFTVGSIVHNNQTLLFSPPVIDKNAGTIIKAGTKPVEITVVGLKSQRFTEVTAGGVRGLLLNTLDQVKQANGTLDYQEFELKKATGIKRFGHLDDFVVLVKRPEHCQDDDSVFIYSIEGSKYAMCILRLAKSAWTSLAKNFIYSEKKNGCLLAGFYTRAIQVTTVEKKFDGGKGTWVPVGVAGNKSSPEFINFVVEHFGTVKPTEQAEAAAQAAS
jgi:hypothetical protein